MQEAASLSLQDAGMSLCKWSTNSDELKNLWKEKMENTEQDDFIFDLRNLIDFLKNKSNTKRGVLQAAACIFDPVGVKCLFQQLWENGLEWGGVV